MAGTAPLGTRPLGTKPLSAPEPAEPRVSLTEIDAVMAYAMTRHGIFERGQCYGVAHAMRVALGETAAGRDPLPALLAELRRLAGMEKL